MSKILQRVERLKSLISAQAPLDLEAWVRSVLVHYFFHVSDRGRIELSDEGPRVLNLLSPTVFKGAGRFRFSNHAVFGVPRSPGAYACSYIESRTPESLIEIGRGTVFNNRATLISEGAAIRFGQDCLIGPELLVLDSNSHELAPARRREPDRQPREVRVGNNVFIGARVTLLKGVEIGDGCIVSAGAVVTPGFKAPPLSIVAGNPARVIGSVPQDETPPAPAV
ncbi:UNVERIFIED_ORG: acyltransferase [Shinella sp. XGS7]|nr:acyltransferase [Shinella sp. XGS7]